MIRGVLIFVYFACFVFATQKYSKEYIDLLFNKLNKYPKITIKTKQVKHPQYHQKRVTTNNNTNFTIQTIINSKVFINNKAYKIDQKINGWTIIEIQKNFIKIKKDNRIITKIIQ